MSSQILAAQQAVNALIPKPVPSKSVPLSKEDGDLAYIIYNCALASQISNPAFHKTHIDDRNATIEKNGQLQLGIDARIIDGNPELTEAYGRMATLTRTDKGYYVSSGYTPEPTKFPSSRKPYKSSVENLKGSWAINPPEKVLAEALQLHLKFNAPAQDR